jgi:glucose-1-phosphate thymidylyltransferase
MNIIVPMAGMGKRMRPHTLTVPKPLIPVAGKPIVQWLIEDIVKVCGEGVNEVAFIVGHFGEEVEKSLLDIAEKAGAKGRIYYQDEPLGTAHAILCAKESLEGNVSVVFADTLFKADFTLDRSKDAIIWVQQVEDPKPFGVVKVDKDGIITHFIEKPQEFVSDLAIIGIYYFKDGAYLKEELQYLIDHDIREKGEYQLTNAMENMKNKGYRFVPGKVSEWLDCGNKNSTVYTNQRMLEIKSKSEKLVHDSLKTENSLVIQPCYIGEGVSIQNSVIGPHVSIGKGCVISGSLIRNSIVQKNCHIKEAHISNSMLGNNVAYIGRADDLSLGDFCTYEQ